MGSKMTAKAWFVIVIELLLSGLIIFLLYGQITDANKRADDAESLAKLRLDTINDMQVRQRDNAALDAKYTGELADAKSENEKLRADIATGKRKLHLNATCPESKTTGASSMGNGEGPRLTADGELNYFRLRDGIATITKQVNYLQDYIRQQCLK